MLKDSRGKWVPPAYAWNDSDPLAIDILSARLRHKYYRSQAMLYRHFLYIILNAPLADVPLRPDDRTMNYASLAIEALIKSTQAFHGVDSRVRIAVTNLSGMAHAQCGSLLLLAACCRHESLSEFTKQYDLENIFTRTIDFFRMLPYPPSPLMTIILSLARDLRFDSSFSSVKVKGA
ncbi:hypothetical protein F4778DRAFT_779553 [Xylariomycetidae sp. FL2044]|nr:hypothetical protein F4778DRAFT_779553 [Xylariomycetidae sp. FL2044]